MHEMIDRINSLKRERRAVILAHVYQPPEIQDLGDYVGDSLGLCIQAAQTDADVIVFCGVRFMAESAKLLNFERTVLLPVLDAGCPMADMADAAGVRRLREQHPGAAVVCYVNSTAEVKAESDLCCTSSNAVRVVSSLPQEQQVLFVPDRHLGQYVAEQTGRDLVLWPGYCPTHQMFLVPDIEARQAEWPDAPVLAHPECPKAVRDMADQVGSTGQILEYCAASDKRRFIICTEEGIMHRLCTLNPGKEFVSPTRLAVCKNMKKITLADVLACLQDLSPEISMERSLAQRAVVPIERMLAIS